MYAFVAGLLLMAALAVAPGVGGFLHQSQALLPVAPSASPSADPGRTPVSHDPAPVSQQPTPAVIPSARKQATDLVDRYEAALVAGKWQTAFDLLATASLTHEAGLATFASERAAFFDSVDGRYTIGNPARVSDWTTYEPLVAGAVRSRAWLIEVDYPALSNNNAGFEQFVVAPDSSGAWRIWPVR